MKNCEQRIKTALKKTPVETGRSRIENFESPAIKNICKYGWRYKQNVKAIKI